MKESIQDINQEISEAMKLDVMGYHYLIKKLGNVQRSLEATVAKEREKRVARAMVLSQYETEQEIQDAYGYDLITDDERYQLLRALEAGKSYVEDTQTKTTVALNLLEKFLRQLNRQADSLDFELLPPAEKAKRLAIIEEIRERAKERHAAR